MEQMNMLEKFNTVSVDITDAIPLEDKKVCEAHQKAYENALATYGKLLQLCKESTRVQEEIYEDISETYTRDFLYTTRFDWSTCSILETRRDFHSRFIHRLVEYFSRVHHIDNFDKEKIKKALLPQEPEQSSWGRDEAYEEYEEKLDTLTLSYKDIVAEILQQMGGYSFEDAAYHELQSKCSKAAWYSNREISIPGHGTVKGSAEPRFERKKDTLQFKYGCDYRNLYESFSITKELGTILRGMSHYETNSCDILLNEVSTLLRAVGRYGINCENTTFEFLNCKKIKSVKLFKNSRVDLKFQSEACAQEFVEKYLMPPAANE